MGHFKAKNQNFSFDFFFLLHSLEKTIWGRPVPLFYAKIVLGFDITVCVPRQMFGNSYLNYRRPDINEVNDLNLSISNYAHCLVTTGLFTSHLVTAHCHSHTGNMGWRCSSVGRALDRHTADAGLIPCSSKGFFSQSQLLAQTLIWCLYTPECNRMH